jgi:TolB-like protein
VAPARWAGEDAGSAGNVDQKLAAAIASELTKRRTARVIAFPPAQGARKEVQQVAKDLGATKVLMVDVQVKQGATRVTIYLLDTTSNEKMWVTDFNESGLETSEEQRDLARSVADEFEAKNCKAPPYWSYRISMA